MGDVRQMALAEIARLKRTYDLADDEIVDHRELELLREGRGLVAVDGVSAGDRFVRSASLAEYRKGMASSVVIPVAEPHELAAVVTIPLGGRNVSDVNRVAELGDPILGNFTIEPLDSGLLVTPLRVTGAEVTGLGLVPTAGSKEIALVSAVPDREAVRFAGHVNEIPKDDLRNDARARRIVDTIVRRYWLRDVAREVILGTGATAGDRQQLSGLAAATIASFSASTGAKTDHLVDATAAVLNAWGPPVHVIGNALDLKAAYKEASWRRDRFDGVVFAPTNVISQGTVWVTALRAITVHMSTLTIEVADDHSDNWSRGVVTIQPQAWVWCEVEHTDSAAKITNWA
jgi:hypothetical protein